MTIYSDRPITVVELPVAVDTIVLHPEQALIKCITGIDIGALCFLKRSNEQRKRGRGRKVALDSFDKSRASSIGSFLNKFLQESAMRRLSVSTCEGRCWHLVNFLDWCDTNGHAQALESVDEGQKALKGFILHLRHLSDIQSISLKTAHSRQYELIQILQFHFDISNISLGINRINFHKDMISRTEAPTQERLAKFLSFHEAIFDGICSLVLKGEGFPWAIEMPEFVGYNNNTMWIFPTAVNWARHPELIRSDKHNKATDYINGRIKSVDEVAHLYCSRTSAIQSIGLTLKHLSRMNSEVRSAARIRCAALANLLFTRIFEAVTGANGSDIRRIEWTSELEMQIAKPNAERQGFRSVKVRANNRDVYYQIGIKYFPLLRKFIKLRAWLLDGTAYEYMFFNYIATKGIGTPGPSRLKQYHYNYIIEVCLFIYPGFKKIGLSNRKTRAAKQDNAIRNYDPATSARIMQHSLATAVRHYSNGSAEVAREEMGDFLQKVHKVVTDDRRLNVIKEERATGGCISINKPQAITIDPPIKPDCIRSEGCLFCDKYRAHADEKDVRKLLSAKFVVEQTAALASSTEEYDRVFGATIKRIEQILIEICNVDASMSVALERIAKEVARGDLDIYWSTKMEELLEAGVL